MGKTVTRILVILLCLVPLKALSDPAINVTREAWKWALVDDQNVPVKDSRGVAIKTDTLDQCAIEAVKMFGPLLVEEGTYRCTTLVRLKVSGYCTAQTPEPTPKVDDDGFTVIPELPQPEDCPEGFPNKYRLLENKWVVKYPKCGEYQPVESRACGYVVPDEVARVPGDLLDEYHAEVKPGSDPAEVCHTVDCNE